MSEPLHQVKDSLKATLHGGMLFEAMGVRYFGPVDGHSLPNLIRYLELVKDLDGPVLLHVLTEKGHGFKPAVDDPVFFHTPAPFECDDDDCIVSVKKSSSRAYTDVASESIAQAMHRDHRVTVITAAMCQGNKLEAVREAFPTRFFDVGICESHAVAFAAGQAKVGDGRSSTSTARFYSGPTIRFFKRSACKIYLSFSCSTERVLQGQMVPRITGSSTLVT